VLAFTSAYFSESSFFKGLWPIQIKKSRCVSDCLRSVSSGFRLSFLLSGAPRREFDPGDETKVARLLVFCKEIVTKSAFPLRSAGAGGRPAGAPGRRASDFTKDRP
jgi:hypothetical protein